MIRHSEGEILNREGIPVEVVGQAYRDIARIHHRLGDTRGVIRAIGRAPRLVWRVLDVGCATGLVVHEVGLRLGVSVVAVEIKPHASISAAVSIVQADARCDRLPVADVAYCIHLSLAIIFRRMILLP
jgi:hypothetical protein